MLGRWYEIATGVLMWTPTAFWAATVDEFLMATVGYRKANNPGPDPMTRSEMLRLVEDNPPTMSLRRKRGGTDGN